VEQKKLNRKTYRDGHPDSACDQSESDRDRPELEIVAVVETLDRSSNTQLNIHQPIDEPKSMDYEESEPTLRTSPTPETIPWIRKFLQQILQIDE
jgi:hypothetical protein